MMLNQKNHGFSLVALVISIVFLGMIVGGVIFARYLINSADAIVIIERVSKYESAIMMFHKNYKEYPGDSANFSPAGDINKILNDQLGECARAPDEKLINEEKYQFWAHLSQANMLEGEKYEGYSPPSCGGSHDENWAAPAHAGILWPYIQLDEKASAVFGVENGSKAPFVADIDKSREAVFLTFTMNAADAIPFAHKFAKEAHAANQVDLRNLNGDDNCQTAGVDDKGQKIAEIVSCKDANAALAKFVYYVKTE